MNKFLEKYNLPTLNEEAVGSLNRPITPDEIETIIKKFPAQKSLEPNCLRGEFYGAFKGERTPILHRLFLKIQEYGRLLNIFMKSTSS